MTSLTSVCIDPGVICEHNLFTAGSVGSVQVMVAMLLLHAGVALQAAVVLPVASPIDEWHRAGQPTWWMRGAARRLCMDLSACTRLVATRVRLLCS